MSFYCIDFHIYGSAYFSTVVCLSYIYIFPTNVPQANFKVYPASTPTNSPPACRILSGI